MANNEMMADFLAKDGKKKIEPSPQVVTIRGKAKSTAELVVFKLDQAAKLLAEAHSAQATIEVMAIAAAQATYAKQRKLSEDIIADANTLRLLAMQKLGEMLEAAPKAKGGKPYQKPTGSNFEPVQTQQKQYDPNDEWGDSPPTLAEMRIDKKLSTASRKLVGKPLEEIREMAQPKPEKRGGARQKRTKHCPTCTCVGA
jgi:hypothetical protein